LSASPTQRSLAWFRERGYLADVAERRIRNWITKDLFGFADIVAVHPASGEICFCQTTTAAHIAARVAKAEALDTFRPVLVAGVTVRFHGWAKKRGPRGKRKTWELTERIFRRPQ
jgi:hypothetical protein